MSTDFASLQSTLAAHVRDPSRQPAPHDADDRRVGIYRDLVFNNVAGLLGNAFPVLRSLHADDAWRARVRTWLREHRAHTPLFPRIAGEFSTWLARCADDGAVPLWQAELADYEWVETELANDERDIDDVPHDPHGDLLAMRPVVSPLARRLVYRHAVQHIRVGAVPTHTPSAPTHIVVARDRNDRVSFTAINALTATLLDRLALPGDATGRSVLLDLARDAGTPPETMLAAGSALLAQLRSRDIVLGTVAP